MDKFAAGRMKKYSACDADNIFDDFHTSLDGLKLNKVDEMRGKYGDNIFSGNNKSVFLRLKTAFINSFSLILLVIAFVSGVTDFFLGAQHGHDYITVMILVLMVLISGIIRFSQDSRSKKQFDKVKRLENTDVKVRRDGVIINTTADQLVVGDCVILSSGDRVPADMRIIKSVDLCVSQAVITGESDIIKKDGLICKTDEKTVLSQCRNLVFFGTNIVSGSAECIVLAVGKDTLCGSFVSEKTNKSNSFQKGSNSIAGIFIKFMAVLIPVVFVVSGIAKGNLTQSLLFSLSVAVGLTPEMLPMIISVCLARGSSVMSKKQTIVKNMDAMQAFGSMDVLCVDKTGTLTNESILLEYYIDVLGNESQSVLDFGYLNSLYHSGYENSIDKATKKISDMPNKIEYFKELQQNHFKLFDIPFDYERKAVSVLVSDKEENLLIMKGDVNTVFSKCSYVEIQNKILPIGLDDKKSVDAVVSELMEDGMQVIAVAKKFVGSKTEITADDETGLVFLGYLVYFDAPKKSASEAVKKLSLLQVKTKVLTGDNIKTTRSVCKRIGVDYKNILTGAEIDDLSDSDLMIAVEKTDVFVQLSPSQKVRIITILHENGHTVGFLGDGMNDYPAVCEADIGISADNAVDVVKDAADVMLLQKDLNVLEQGIVEGRKTFANMSKYIKITASSNFGNILSIICASVFLPFSPMVAVQILLLNILYDILCLVLPWDRVDEVNSAPRDWSGKSLGRFMMCFGPISSVFDIITFVFLYFVLCPILCGGVFTSLTDPIMQAQYIALFQTGWFLESMWTQIMIIHMLRTKETSLLASRASLPVRVITVMGIIMFTAFTFTGLASYVGLTALPIWYFAFLLVIVSLYMLTTTIVKRIYIKKHNELT